MVDVIDTGSVMITGHLLIRDTDTGEILVNKSESSSVITNDKLQKENDKDDAR